MRTIIKLSLFACLALTLACAPAANTNTSTNANSNTNANATAKAAPPTADALLAMETKAWEAWKNKDTKHFEGIMSDKLVMVENGKRMDRAEAIKMIGGHPCDVKSFSLSDPKVTTVSSDVVVVTYKGTSDGTCEGQKLPSPVTAASVWVRSGNDWKAAYHSEVPRMEAPPAGAATADKKEESGTEKKEMPAAPAPKNDATATSNSSNSNANAAAAASSDALTDAIMAVEKKGWEAWMKQDAATMQTVTTKDVSFVDVTGKATHGQADVIKGWTDGSCKVSSVDVSDGKATMIADNVAILTFKGTAVGTCGPMKLAPLWGTTVAVKEGDSWKAAYIFEVPVM